MEKPPAADLGVKPSPNGMSFSSHRYSKVVLVMVGLPARGKSYLAHKVVSYYNWLGLHAKIFNVGKHRRHRKEDKSEEHDQSFFDAGNEEGTRKRNNIAMEVLQELLDWLELGGGGSLAVFDATNTTDARRRAVLKTCKERDPSLNIIFVEMICNDAALIRSNLLVKVANSPDYRHLSVDAALSDLEARIRNYEKVYQPVTDLSLSYIKLINLQSQVICNRLQGSCAARLTNLLMSTHLSERYVYLVRAGTCEQSAQETENQRAWEKVLPQFGIKARVPHLVAKDSFLDAEGTLFAKQLGTLITEEARGREAPQLYVSTFSRSLETAKHVPHSVLFSEASLNTIDNGSWTGRTTDSFTEEELLETARRYEKDPFEFSFPGGMSLRDGARLLEPLMLELERARGHTVVVAHLATIQLIYGYFATTPRDNIHELEIPSHTVIRFQPSQFGWKETRFAPDRDGGGLVRQGTASHHDSLRSYAPRAPLGNSKL